MAARENQGLQIALIIFVILTILLIVTTFLFFRNFQEAQERIKGLTAENNTKDQAARTALEESAAIRSLMDPSQDKVESVQQAAAADFEAHGNGLAEADQNYLGLVDHMAKQVADANTRITEITAHETELADKLAAEEEATKKAIAEYTQTIQKVTADLEERKKQFDEARELMNQEKGDLNTKFAETQKRFDELSRSSGEQIATLTGEVGRLTNLLTVINDEKNRAVKANEVPDGAISWVNQRTRTVWINVGSDDGLRRQTAFSVFPVHAANPIESDSKGKIEVTRLMGGHMAEARIVEDDLSEPLMPGDRIFSPTWEPGRPERFGLAGHMDIDGDGTDDRQRIRNLIEMNGGVIDEELTADGTRKGRMSIQTKYLVLGDQPPAVEGSSALEGWSEIRSEAQTLGTRLVNVREFLDYMGYEPQERTVNLGSKTKPGDFKPRLPDGVQRTLPGSEGPGDLRRRSPRREDY